MTKTVKPQFEKNVPSAGEPVIKFTDPQELLERKMEEIKQRHEFQTNLVLGIFVVAFITMILMVGGILLDAWHFNSAIYREYTMQLEDRGNLQKVNQSLSEDNKQLLQLVNDNQKVILERFKDQK